MLAMFGSAAAAHGGLLSNPLVKFLLVLLSVFVFLKFCGWAKKFQLSRGVKKIIFIFTGIGVVIFNVLYSMGNKAIEATGDWTMATTALLISLIAVFVFAFALMSETKPD